MALLLDAVVDMIQAKGLVLSTETRFSSWRTEKIAEVKKSHFWRSFKSIRHEYLKITVKFE
jgi:hypothetical protein